MSVLVIATMKGDRAEFDRVHKERADDFRAIAAQAKQAGAIHHRFGAGNDGTFVIVDEWPDAQSFQNFFGNNPAIDSLTQDAGMQGPPEITIVEALNTVDQF